jgi:tetratricopeptide (TPR) repeat protein
MRNMDTENNATQPSNEATVTRDTTPGAVPGEGSRLRKSRRWLWALGGVLLLLLTTVSGGYAGYRSALNDRLQKEAANLAMVALAQYQLGLEDLAAGRYETALDRFEYVIELDANFPGAAEKLTEAMLAMAMVSTPTPRPTPTIAITPTPDLRSVEELFATAVQHMRSKEWDMAIQTLDRLREEDLSFRPLDVDGMYYIALRYRGVQKIIFEGNLERGMYDLSLAENFGPLDHEANGYRNWARLYVAGASFWEIDWERVLSHFSQIYRALPNLRDGSNMTAVERFRRASIGYADQLVAAEDACAALEHYTNALSITEDAEVRAKMDAAFLICYPPEPTPEPVVNTPTPTPTTTEITPTPGDMTVTPEATPETPPPPGGGSEG